MKFIFPHYEPEKPAEDLSYPEARPEEQPTSADIPQPITQNASPGTESQTQLSEDKNSNFQQQIPDGSDEYFTNLMDIYRANVLNDLQPGHPRTDVIVRYYKHPPDGQKVYALRDLGFYIHERPVEQSMANYESNAIYYGDNVRKEDLLIVAYTLINQGMPIKIITPSLYHDDWKSNAIEIGADSTVINKNPLKPQELKELQFDFL